MKENNTRYIASIVYKCLIILIGLFSLMANFNWMREGFDAGRFSLFTTQSNIWIILYFLIEIIFLILDGKKALNHTWCPILKCTFTMCITLTFLVAHFMLQLGFTFDSWVLASGLGLHYIVPIMAILDWLIFDVKGRMKKYYPFAWLVVPYLYFILAILDAKFGTGFGIDPSKYPYDFIDISAHGLKYVVIMVGILSVLFVILGFIAYIVDYFLAEHSKNKRSMYIERY